MTIRHLIFSTIAQTRMRLSRLTCKLARNVSGATMLTFALIMPVMLLAVGSGIDYGYMYMRKASLQSAADAAALAGAKELLLANADTKVIGSVAQQSVMANIKRNSEGVVVTTQVSIAGRSVKVTATQTPGLVFLGELIGKPDINILVDATARVKGEMPICMLVLEPSESAALTVNSSGRITGNDCAIYSNSVSSRGISTKNGSMLASALTCSAGGFKGEPDTYNPVPLTDCPPISDPLASRQPPPVGPCTKTDLVIDSGKHTLNPGTYCGGLRIKGTADVTLRPGVYVIKDDELEISGNASLTGEYVGFYMTGDDAKMKFQPNTTIELSAPKDGPLAGLLFFEDRNNEEGGRHSIRSNNARSFVGTFYLSRGSLVVDATKPVFDQSAYTVIITNEMDMFSGPNLVLNSNYGITDVPRPSELKGASSPGKKIVLVD